MLLAGKEERHLAWHLACIPVLESLLWGTGLAWNNSEKMAS